MFAADDPYYCGLRARVPNFVKMAKNGQGKVISPYGNARPQPPSSSFIGHPPNSQPPHIYGHHGPPKRPPVMYHARSFESGLGMTNQLSFECLNIALSV